MTNKANWRKEFNAMPISGFCDAGCGELAKYWFGDTALAHCGASTCINELEYERSKLIRQIEEEEQCREC